MEYVTPDMPPKSDQTNSALDYFDGEENLDEMLVALNEAMKEEIAEEQRKKERQ